MTAPETTEVAAEVDRVTEPIGVVNDSTTEPGDGLTVTEAAPDSTDAWLTAGRAHLERLVADADAAHQAAPKRRRWWAAPVPWLVVRQYHQAEHVVCAHRWEWAAELCSTRRERHHRSEWGVFYTARHRTHLRTER